MIYYSTVIDCTNTCNTIIYSKNSIDEYMNFLYSKSSIKSQNNSLNNTGKLGKDRKIKKNATLINNEEIPSVTNYNILIQNNYNVQQLKRFVKYYKLKVSGNKNELVNRVYCFLKLSSLITPFQKLFRGYIQRKYNWLHGPAYMKRGMCVNQFDFLTMEELTELPFSQFFSYKDVDGFVYGFDILSLYNLIQKSSSSLNKRNSDLLNPYNRNVIDKRVTLDIKQLLRISKLLNIAVEIQIQDITPSISQVKSIELQVLDIFQTMDSLGNYSNPEWFLSLNVNVLNKFMRELTDIWNYRAQLDNEVKKMICPPLGNPFFNVNIQRFNHDTNMENKRRTILTVLDKMVKTGINRDYNALGAYYILAALTLVNESAAMALPWLYQSVCYY